MDLRLKDKRALVTGSSRGLGYATALALAKEGCKVAINGRDEAKIKVVAEKMSKETGAQVIGLAGDVGLADVPEKLIQQAVEAFGGLDILITNAGGPPPGSIDSLDEAAWQKGVDLSLMAHVRLIKAALPYLRKSDAASVLTVTSMSVKQPIANLAFVEQYPHGNDWVDQIFGVGTRQGKHSLQFDSARLDADRKSHRVDDCPGNSEQVHS